MPQSRPAIDLPPTRSQASTPHSAAQQSWVPLSSGARLVKIFRDLVEETGGGEPALVGAVEKRKVLGNVAVLHRLHAALLQRVGEFRELGIVVELGAVGEPPRPGED